MSDTANPAQHHNPMPPEEMAQNTEVIVLTWLERFGVPPGRVLVSPVHAQAAWSDAKGLTMTTTVIITAMAFRHTEDGRVSVSVLRKDSPSVVLTIRGFDPNPGPEMISEALAQLDVPHTVPPGVRQ